MRKCMLLFICIVISFFLVGCLLSNSPNEPPEITITIKDEKIDYVFAKNQWNRSEYDRESTFVTILKELPESDIPYFENGSIVEIVFESNPPNEFYVSDILIDETGRPIYTDKEIKNIPVKLTNGKCQFEIEYHFAYALSSYYAPDKKSIRGFRMIASWGENECEYAFVVKTGSTL
ncbi:MAG: hypothetical protein PHE29_04855 [Tissierellia bacterium]|nr:hypothetical protein [Tissierellia bacterium]